MSETNTTSPPDPAAAASQVSWEEAVAELREDPSQADLVRDAYYDDPLIDAARRYHASGEWRAIRPYLPTTPGKVLDVGAGRGIASFAFASDGHEVVALEPDPSDIVGGGAIRGLAQAADLPITVEQGTGETLPFADATFDVVFARAVLHHADDLPAACKEFARVLKPGGQLIAVREHVLSKDSDLQAFFDIHPLHNRYGGEYAYRLPVYEAAIRQAGLRMDHVLAPLESEINFAPHTQQSLNQELARKLGKIPGTRGLVEQALGAPGLGGALRGVLSRLDNRPGRLYSFVASRPSGKPAA